MVDLPGPTSRQSMSSELAVKSISVVRMGDHTQQLGCPLSIKMMGLLHMDVSENSGFSPKSSILIGFSIVNHPFWGTTIFGNTYMV